MTRSHLSRGTWILCALVAVLSVPGGVSLGADPLEGVATRMTREAVDAGIAGQDELREATLTQVMELAPEYAPARWEAGQIRVDGQWLPVAQSQSKAKSDPRLEQYRARRAEATDEAASQGKLAQWCDEQGLTDEAEYHWRRVLGVEPQNQQALDRLGVAWFQGQLQPRENLESLRQRQQHQTASLKEWNMRIDGWMRKMGGGETQQHLILEEMRTQIDESAIPAFEQQAGSTRSWKTSQGKRRIELCKAFVEVIADRETFAGTQTLVRHTLLAQHDEIRRAALARLPEKSQDEVVPLLLSSLAAPIESRFDIRLTPSGRAVYTHRLFIEGAERDQVAEISREGVVGQELPTVDSPNAGDVVQSRLQSQRTRANYVNNFSRSAAVIERQVASENANRQTVNKRAVDALKLVTGKDLGANPVDWWKDWQESTGYEASTYRPTDVVRDADSFYVYLPPPREELPVTDIPDRTGDSGDIPRTGPGTRPGGVLRNPNTGMLRSTPPGRRYECFVAGTLVWTKTGQQAIETLEAGDQVLAQDLTSGELLFRPVLETTVRSPSPMVHIATSGETITATEGHPFWLPGRGWRMARQLEPGDRILTLDGPVAVEQVSAAPDAEAFNLVVAEHANYFVGKAGMLVHDNTPRRAEEASQLAR